MEEKNAQDDFSRREQQYFYKSWYDDIQKLPPDMQLTFFKAICAYMFYGDLPDFTGLELMAWNPIKRIIDFNTGRYAEKVLKNRENGKQGGRPKNRTVFRETERFSEKPKKPVIDIDIEKDKEKEIIKPLVQSDNEYRSKLQVDCESLILNDGSDWQPTVEEYREYERLYPAVDVKQAFRDMRGWLDSNPSRRKTSKGIRRFVNAWLSKQQDRGSYKEPEKPKAKTEIYKYPVLKRIEEG